MQDLFTSSVGAVKRDEHVNMQLSAKYERLLDLQLITTLSEVFQIKFVCLTSRTLVYSTGACLRFLLEGMGDAFTQKRPL